MKINISFLFLLLTAHGASAQNSVVGKVIDSLTREPIPFANVYFAGTAIGTTTSEDGSFSLGQIPPGKYDLTASFVGYHPAQRSLAFENTKHEVTLVLFEKTTQLEEVVIRSDNRHRASNLTTFKMGFLGTTKNTATTRIMNEADLDFDFEPQKTFTAFTYKPLEIVNEALGYKIIYDLQVFEINYETQTQLYLGFPRFENLGKKIKGRWKRERNRAYRGSMMHFIHMLKKGDMGDEFAVHEFYRKQNPERPPADVLKAKIKYWALNQLSEGGVIKTATGTSDSLNYYLSLQRKPEFLDIVGRKITHIDTLLNAERNMITYTGMLYVVYKKEAEEDNYAFQQRRPVMPRQASIIHILQPVKIYDNGYFEDTQSIYFEGYMGWAEKVSDLLPLGYRPDP